MIGLFGQNLPIEGNGIGHVLVRMNAVRIAGCYGIGPVLRVFIPNSRSFRYPNRNVGPVKIGIQYTEYLRYLGVISTGNSGQNFSLAFIGKCVQ